MKTYEFKNTSILSIGDSVQLIGGVDYAGLKPYQIGTVTSIEDISSFSVNGYSGCYCKYWLRVENKNHFKNEQKNSWGF